MEFRSDFSVATFNNDGRRRVQDNYRRKYIALKRKCDSIELSNERVLNRLCHVKKYIHKLSSERRGLAKKLTQLGDEFKKSELTVPLEDDLPINVLGISESPSSSGALPAGDGQGEGSPPGVQGGGPIKTEDGPLAPPPPTPSGHGKPSGKKKRSRDTGKSEREKDPNAPKKPANAFLMYCQQERQKVQDGEGNGIYSADLSHQDLTRQLAKQWKFLSEDEKKHYYQMYEKEKDRYDKAVKKYAKAGGDKRNMKREEEADAESETIDVVKMGQERDVKKKEIRDEFEFTDFPIIVDEPKICLEKIDKSKLFDKARLFGLPSPPHNAYKAESEAKGVPVKDLILNSTDAKLPLRMPGGMDFRGPSILEVKTGHRTSAAPTLSAPFVPRMPPRIQMRPPAELTIKELVGMRASAAFEMQNQPMMELKAKSPAEDRTVLASAFRNKPMFDMSPRYTPEPKPAVDAAAPRIDAADNKPANPAEMKSKVAVEIRSRMSTDSKAKLAGDPKPRAFSDTKVKPLAEPKIKPAIVESRSISVPDVKVKPSPEIRRMSLENKKPVVELRKFPVDPSDDPYHFDD